MPMTFRSGMISGIFGKDKEKDKNKENGTSDHAQILVRRNSQTKSWFRFINWIIPGTHNHITMKKRILQWKQLSKIGRFWDFLQIFLSILACGMYIAETYSTGFNEHLLYSYVELVVTQFFLLDFIFNWFTAVNTKVYMASVMTIVDILTIFPVYIGILTGSEVNLSIFRFIRILRLVRVLRTFRLLGNLSGLKKQLITLTLTLLSLTFMAAGIINVLENDMKQLGFKCKYSNVDTNFRPSCEKKYNNYNADNCDCLENNCRSSYTRYDVRDEPTGINCVMLPFFDCFYYIVVTISTVGYGDISPSTTASRAVVMLFIATSAVVIPMQLKQLTQIIATHSVFRKAYDNDLEEHVVLCGHVNDKKKLDKFLKEFFHPDRTLPSSPQFHVVILCPEDPSEEVRSLLLSPNFDSHVTYLIGSALSVEDLQRAKVDRASAVFFLTNIEAKEDVASAQGTSTVLRTLAVSDFNPDAQCLVEVTHSHDSDILKNSDVAVVLCVDEFKTVMLARNAVCPGISTLVNNMFRTYGGAFTSKNTNDHWLKEYHYGECMETYYISIPSLFIQAFSHEWSLAVEGIYLEYGCIILGLFDPGKGKIILNPVNIDFRVNTLESNYVCIILAPDGDTAATVNRGMSEHQMLAKILNKVTDAEKKFAVRVTPKQEGTMQRAQSSRLHAPRAVDDGPRIQDIVMFCKLQRAERKNKGTATGHYVPVVAGKGLKRGDPYAKIAPATDRILSKSSSSFEEYTSHKSNSDIAEENGQIEHAFDLTNHIIVFGCMDNIYSFIEFADVPLVNAMDDNKPRTILFIGPEIPHRWSALRKKHPQIFFMEGDISDSSMLARTNINRAFSVVMLSHRREGLDFEEDENLDFEMLFLYLKISSFIPSDVHFTVELTSGQNMGVLNSVAVRKETIESAGGGDGAQQQEADSSYSLFFSGIGRDDDKMLAQMKQDYANWKPKRRSRQTRGVFYSQYKSVLPTERLPNREALQAAEKLQRMVPGRRLSSIQLRNHSVGDGSFAVERHIAHRAWDGFESHYNLAIYASGRAFVPDVVDNILCQSFFTSMTSNLCEALVCGQEDQGIFLIDIPRTFIYRYFGDIFRACLARSVLPLGLYRGASKTENSYMPFVYTCPPPRTVLNMSDRVYVFGAPKDIKAIQKVLALPFQKKGNLLQLGVDEETVGVRRRSMAPSNYGHGPAGSRSSIAGNSVLNAALAAKKAVEEAGG